jgi:hypothetical protein
MMRSFRILTRFKSAMSGVYDLLAAFHVLRALHQSLWGTTSAWIYGHDAYRRAAWRKRVSEYQAPTVGRIAHLYYNVAMAVAKFDVR